jgi:hypothetical protein
VLIAGYDSVLTNIMLVSVFGEKSTDTFQHEQLAGGLVEGRSLTEDHQLREHWIADAFTLDNKKGMSFDNPPQWFFEL